MTGRDDEVSWPAFALAEQMQDASEDVLQGQQALFQRWLSTTLGGESPEDLSRYAATSVQTATFKTRVQSGGRISIPDVERDALDIDEGDIVQAVVLPIPDRNGD